MKNADKNRDPERAQKRALVDARCAWRKMNAAQRAHFMEWIVEGQTGELSDFQSIFGLFTAVALEWREGGTK